MTTQSDNLEVDWGSIEPSRRQRFAQAGGAPVTRRIEELAATAAVGLATMYDAEHQRFPQTMRGHRSPSGPVARPEGDSLRYAAIVALGLGLVRDDVRAEVLGGAELDDFVRRLVERALHSEDVGAVALTAWAAAESADLCADELFLHMDRRVTSSRPIDTVECAWVLTAALSASRLSDLGGLITAARGRLIGSQGTGGLFPHVLPPASQRGYRAHVGCFADQVYPIQAFARLHAVTDDALALEVANRCADRIVELQGADGQWWWHYDARNTSVVERFPVYSVHQHAMAPMALLDLAEAGGRDHSAAVLAGLHWIDRHPEVMGDLVSEPLGMIWRKVGRREPAKLSRGLGALVTSHRPGTTLPLVDILMPATEIDYECRPYELGWLLYAWNGSGVFGALAGGRRA